MGRVKKMLFYFYLENFVVYLCNQDEVICFERPKYARKNNKTTAGGWCSLGTSMETMNDVAPVNFEVMMELWLEGTSWMRY